MNRNIAKLITFPIPCRKTRHRLRKYLEKLDIDGVMFAPVRITKILISAHKKNTVYLIEANPFNAECMYSVYKHFNKNNKNIIILTTKQNIKKNLFAKNVKMFCIKPMDLRFLDNINFFKNAKLVFVNSYFIWDRQSTADKFFTNYIKTGRPLLAIDHSPNLYDYKSPVPENVHRFVLSDFLRKKYDFPAFYTFDFPKTANINIFDKKFISVGVIGDILRRDTDTYLDILESKPNMFSYIISGMIFPGYRERLNKITNIKIFEQASFDELFKCCLKSTFIPFLIHDESLPLYRDRITGNINLVFGFGLIPIIDKKLAKLYNINNTTGILYNGKKDLARAVNDALNLSVEEILSMRQNILNLAAELHSANDKTINNIISQYNI